MIFSIIDSIILTQDRLSLIKAEIISLLNENCFKVLLTKKVLIKKSLGLNAFLNGLRSAINLIFLLITFPHISRLVLGIGIYNFSNIYVYYFIVGLGIATYAVHEGAKYRNQKEKIEEFVSQVLSINMIATVITYLLILFVF